LIQNAYKFIGSAIFTKNVLCSFLWHAMQQSFCLSAVVSWRSIMVLLGQVRKAFVVDTKN